MSFNESKWAQTGLNEPKIKMGLYESEWPQKTLNILKIILYKFKNRPKWTRMSKPK